MTKKILKLFIRELWRFKKLVIPVELAATVFIFLQDIYIPYIISRIIQKLTEAQTQAYVFEDFKPLIYTLIAAVSVRFIFGRVMTIGWIHYWPQVARNLELISYKKLSEHSMSFFADNHSGALVARVSRLSSAFQRFDQTVMGKILMTARGYLFYVVALFLLAPPVAAVLLVWSLAFCYMVYRMHRAKFKYSLRSARDDSEVTATLADGISNMLTVRLFGAEDRENKRFEKVTEKRRQSRFKTQLVGEYIRISKALSMRVFDVIVIIMTIKLVLDGQVDIGTAVLMQFYVQSLTARLWDFGKDIDAVEEAFADAAEMMEILELEPDVTDPKSPEASAIANGNISFDNVQFTYEDSASKEQLFRDFSIQIPAGQKVGLVGPSGSGKSTLTKLITRLMNVQAGSISVDGQDITHITQADLRRNIAFVPQEPLLFHRSVLENIRYANPEASLEEVREVAKKAHALEFIEKLPQGFDTVVGERGVKLSGGQKQRVAIARAMLKQTPILILDEATSSLDSESEKHITTALDSLMKNRTTIVIAHRLSTIQKMDRILVLDNGVLVEDGSHKKLVNGGGVYSRLWKHQHGEFIGEE